MWYISRLFLEPSKDASKNEPKESASRFVEIDIDQRLK